MQKGVLIVTSYSSYAYVNFHIEVPSNISFILVMSYSNIGTGTFLVMKFEIKQTKKSQ